LESAAGRLLRAHAGELSRELPVYVAEHPHASADPLDAVMHRGRIDVLIPHPEGAVVIDYKTDHVKPADVPARAEAYAAQATAYRRAVEAITGKPVRQVLFVFLQARVVHSL
jgi:ATP-dependent helicase/nuclease subunit A